MAEMSCLSLAPWAKCLLRNPLGAAQNQRNGGTVHMLTDRGALPTGRLGRRSSKQETMSRGPKTDFLSAEDSGPGDGKTDL